MKIAIVFSSVTGNTAQVAQAIRQGCQGHEVIAFGAPPQDVDGAELIFAGSWTDKGTCAEEMKAFLAGLHGKRVAVFGTAGFGLSETYFASLGDRFQAEVPADNQVAGVFFCMGKMPAAVRARYEAMLRQDPGNARVENMLQAYDLAQSHPDGADLDRARAFAGKMLNTHPQIMSAE